MGTRNYLETGIDQLNRLVDKEKKIPFNLSNCKLHLGFYIIRHHKYYINTSCDLIMRKQFINK